VRAASSRAGPHPADLIVFAAFLAVPLVATPHLWDQFTTAKWYTLLGLAGLWTAVEAWSGPAWRWPGFLQRFRVLALALAALPLLGALRSGWGWALTPLVERAGVAALALCAFRYACRSPRPLRWPARGAAAAAIATNALLSAQILGADPLRGLSASDGRSALFGNANMAAQFLGGAFLLLLVARPRPGRARWLQEALLAWTAAHLYFLSSRSVLLGTVGLPALLRIGAGAVLVAALLLSAGAADDYLGGARRFKGLGAPYRLALWRSTLPLIADHPLGVGSYGFVHAFPPYQVRGSLPRDEAVEYRHPHNEPLRVAAEEGWAFAAIAAALGAALLRELARARPRRRRGERGAFLLAIGAFLAVEALFQFPLAMAFGALLFALWLGVALASLGVIDSGTAVINSGTAVSLRLPPVPAGGTVGPHTDAAPRPPGPPLRVRWLGTVAALAIVGGTARAAWSEYLYVNRPGDLDAQDRACRLDPRNIPACVSAAWLESEAGRDGAARARLLAVLERSPWYGPALKLLGEVALASGDAPAGCFYLWLYDELFHGASSAHGRLPECPAAWLSSFPRQQPVPYHSPFPRRGRDAGG
jgi:hypothetical protein